jgi:hypothetical protein
VNFQQWLAEANAECVRMAGVTLSIFPEHPFMDWHQASMTLRDAVLRVLARDGAPVELFI